MRYLWNFGGGWSIGFGGRSIGLSRWGVGLFCWVLVLGKRRYFGHGGDDDWYTWLIVNVGVLVESQVGDESEVKEDG